MRTLFPGLPPGCVTPLGGDIVHRTTRMPCAGKLSDLHRDV